MEDLLESLGGKSGLKPDHISTRDFGFIANMDKMAGGGPSAARVAELRARQKDNGTFRASKNHIRKMFNIRKL